MPWHDAGPSRRIVLGGLAGTIALASSPAAAAFPDKPVTVVVPFPPGGPNDVIGRLVADILTRAFGVQAIVENRPGAGGATALGGLARAEPGGYVTALASGVGYVTHPLLAPKPVYRVEELRPIVNVTGGPSVIAVPAGSPAKTLEEFLALARQKPGGLSYGSSGVGTTLHLGGELLKKLAGVDILHVPYKGTSEVLVDLIAGRVDMSIVSPLVARKLVDEGRIRALATTGVQRAKGWTDVPTVSQSGVPAYAFDSWYPLLAPAGTPDDVVRRLNEAVVAGVKSKEATDRLEGLGFVAIASTVAEVESYRDAEGAKWGELIRDAKLKTE